MSHPAIPAAIVRERLDDLKSGTLDDLTCLASVAGEGAPVDLSQFERAVEVIRQALLERLANGGGELDDDQFEGAMAADLHQALEGHAVDLLDDPGFWAYVASGPLWFLTRWRENPAKRKQETYHLYLDGTKADSCVPLRMFIRAQAVELNGDYNLASAVPAGTDFWRSHVLRVRTGSKKDLARAVAQQQRDHRMTVDPVREYAKRINRRWSNQVLQALDAESCEEIARAERPGA